MKKQILILLLSAFILGGYASCSHKHVQVNANGNIPPGQAKKITGEKSAKNYAPGQKKKNL